MRRRLAVILPLLGLAPFLPATVGAQGFAPGEAAGRMSVAEGLEVRLVAAEPMVRQPVAIEFDDRGRLWVIQYLQYPNPAGLKRVRVDRYSRTIYDRVPEPPPRGPRGDDRITILEDTDGDGRADRARDFLSGLNLASGLAFGRGGVFVLQAPYLLFYPDRDGDDVPDGEPEVLLNGFGMDDAHSVANSLTWGPDGWLYGLQGSTVTARVRGVEFQQGVWRYEPVSGRFELFAEGGGNMWGLDFDRRGDLFASTNVGGSVLLHAVQGGYYWKSFGKHGPLHNPYTFGYFEHVAHQGVRGGHVAVGGLFYEADAFPEGWRGRYVAADLLDHSVHWHDVAPRGSTFRARQGFDLLRANDTWFAPSDMTLGPDGALYVADWHDRRTAHPDPDADWDRTNGRIFAVRARGAEPSRTPDLTRRSSSELVERLGHPNVWHVRRARRLLAERRDSGAVALLRAAVVGTRGRTPRLEALWALHGCGGLDDGLAGELLADPDPDLRAWAVRLVGDEERVHPGLAARLVERAACEPDVRARAQLAGTAGRLPVEPGLEVAWRLLLRDLDADDPHVPLRLWWAVERHTTDDREAVLRRFATLDAWRSTLVRDAILPRLVRRFAAEATAEGDEACARLLDAAPSGRDRRPLLAVLEDSLRGRPMGKLGPALARAVKGPPASGPGTFDPLTTRLAARAGDRAALDRAIAAAADRQAAEPDRLAMIALLGELSDRASLVPLLGLATGGESDALRTAALGALGRFDDGTIPPALLSAYPREGEPWRRRARDLLLGRAGWARALLAEVDCGRIPAAEVPVDQVRRVSALGDPRLDQLVRKHWGQLTESTPEAKLAEVRRLNNDLRAAVGDAARGRALFREHCATCHKLFGEGNAVGPDLTHANRRDREFLLVSLVDPGGVVRKEYQSAVVQTRDGRVLTGLVAEQTPVQITLLGASGERTAVRRDEVEAVADSPASLMPEDLYRRFTPDALRDLFRYLEPDFPERSRTDEGESN
jgi:putative membrane-bound dehydrogenase-like protein